MIMDAMVMVPMVIQVMATEAIPAMVTVGIRVRVMGATQVMATEAVRVMAMGATPATVTGDPQVMEGTRAMATGDIRPIVAGNTLYVSINPRHAVGIFFICHTQFH